MVLGGFIFFFYRDPERTVPEGAGLVLSPADGRVTSVQRVSLPSCQDDAVLVSLYLSLWDVHVNRVPVSGHIVSLDYRKGRFRPALWKKSSIDNEHMRICIDSAAGFIVVKQIAGMLARRIVCRLHEGHDVTQGDRFGMIRFGSRVELTLPSTVQVRVKQGDHVRAGETIIGKYFTS
jgi:phosphatidylserine decarboxylase